MDAPIIVGVDLADAIDVTNENVQVPDDIIKSLARCILQEMLVLYDIGDQSSGFMPK